MRIFDRGVFVLVLGLGLGLAPAIGFEGTQGPKPLSPAEATRSLAQPPKVGEQPKGVTSLEYAAEQGVTVAQWELGLRYAKGDGVPRSDLRAFKYFGQIADGHAEDSPDSPQARLVSSAFIALGQYYLVGIPESEVKPDPGRARKMFFYAATYFGDSDAQYRLARLYLDGMGGPRDPRQAAKWLRLAANKDQHGAQAILGYMLFTGDLVPRQAPKGLMYLIVAREGAAPEETWINEFYDSAFARASDDERAAARIFLRQWLNGLRD